MSRYLVTGCAGFVGSTLVDALLAEGCEVVGIDAFTDYYPRERKEAAIAEARSDPAFELVEHDLGGRPRRAAALEGDGGDLPPRSAARGSRQLGGRLRALSPRQRPGDASGRRVRGRPRPAARVRLLLVRVRRRAQPIRPRGRASGAGVAIRGHQADLRAPAARPLPQLRARLRGAALLHGVRAPPATRHGVRAAGRDGGGRARLRRVRRRRPVA